MERVRRRACEPAPPRFFHFHTAAELVLFDAVSGTLLTDAARIKLTPGACVWTPPMALHDFALDAGSAAWTLIQYEESFAPDVRSSGEVCVRPSAEDWDRVQVLVGWLEEALASRQAEEARRVLALLLHTATRGAAQSAAPPQTPPVPVRLRPLLERMRSGAFATLSLSDAASMCNLSAPHFSRAFKAAFGVGFSAYRTRVRLDQAALALASSAEPIGAVGYRFGFGSAAYFAAQFRRRFGVAPSDFRARARA